MANHKESNLVFNPFWFRLLLYFFIVIFFPALTLSLFYWTYQIWMNEGIGSAAVIFFWAVASIYLLYVFFPVLGHIATKVSYDEQGFTIERRGKTCRYGWLDISDHQYHGFAGVLHIFDKDHKRIYVGQKLMPGFWPFEDNVNHRINKCTPPKVDEESI